MKRNVLLLLAVILILSCATMALAETPTLTLKVAVSPSVDPNVTYTAVLTGVSFPTQIPVITFYCGSQVVGQVPVNNSGVAILRLTQGTGKYQAVSAWLNTPTPIRSNVVYYSIP